MAALDGLGREFDDWTPEQRADYVASLDEAIAEVWCYRCDLPSVRVVNGEAYCEAHASETEWKLGSPQWNPSGDYREEVR